MSGSWFEFLDLKFGLNCWPAVIVDGVFYCGFAGWLHWVCLLHKLMFSRLLLYRRLTLFIVAVGGHRGLTGMGVAGEVSVWQGSFSPDGFFLLAVDAGMTLEPGGGGGTTDVDASLTWLLNDFEFGRGRHRLDAMAEVTLGLQTLGDGLLGRASLVGSSFGDGFHWPGSWKPSF
ncbi:unnamed protein product [Cuscuta europaea]|uniref:Uncharacterized protein n=1 Tax=Cuscuta europaea TaxID=41803 RepID=A0A9P0ZKP8_CUSEU|nr:unnamed protein product [Cuscuta europaea]